MPFGAVAGSVAASVAGSLISGAMQSGSASGGASAASGISQKAVEDADKNRLADRANFQPFVDTGTTAVNSLGNVLGLNGKDAATAALSNYQASPGYDYQLQQGLRAVDNAAAGRGMLRSGATLKAEQTLGNNLANQDFGNYINRLMGLGTLGLQGAQGQSNSTVAFNNLLSGQATNQEQIAGQNATQQASILGNTASGVTGAIKGADWNSLFGTPGSAGSTFGSSGTTFSGFGGSGSAVAF